MAEESERRYCFCSTLP